MKKYEKPKMKFTEVCVDRAVADTCWGLKDIDDGKGQGQYKGPYYYDIEGKGYMSFYLKSTDGSCGAPDAYNIQYVNSDASEFSEQALEKLLTQKGGNNGQPYKGLTTDFPTSSTGMS